MHTPSGPNYQKLDLLLPVYRADAPVRPRFVGLQTRERDRGLPW